MKDLTEDLVIEAFLTHIDTDPESAEEYKTEFLKTLNKIRSLSETEMLCRVYQLDQGHRGWWLEADGVSGFISDVQMPKDGERVLYNDDRIVVIDGTIHHIPRRTLVVVGNVKKPTGEDS